MTTRVGYHPAGLVSFSDDELGIYRVSADACFRLNMQARAAGLTAVWRSKSAFARQVDQDRPVLVVPFLHNGGPVSQVKSVRCRVWFIGGSEQVGRYTLADFLESSIRALPQQTSHEMQASIAMIMDWTSVVAILD